MQEAKGDPTSPFTRHSALLGLHVGGGVQAAVGTGRRWFSPRVIVDMPTSLAPAQGCVVAIVDAAGVVAKGIQLIHRASCGMRHPQILQPELCLLPLCLPFLVLLRTFRPRRTCFVTGKVP